MSAALRGLVLSGGRSTRMQRDKALLDYAGQTQLERAVSLLQAVTTNVSVSVRPDQVDDPLRARYAQVVDGPGVQGPAAGILAAQQADPTAAWLVLACDLPLLDAATLATLVAGRDPARHATAFRSSHDGLPEPLCTIWEPSSGPALMRFMTGGRNCPRKFLLQHDTLLLDQPNPEALDNVNTPDELRAARQGLDAAATRTLRVQYFALLRDQAGRAEESLSTTATTASELYAELAARYGFTLAEGSLKVAINTEFANWSQPLAAGDTVVFIPPVAGG
jgi:molybdopterin-guanine dinucleotide biosynthesis protein A